MTRTTFLAALAVVVLFGEPGTAAPPRPPATPPSADALLKPEPWQQVPTRATTPAELDALIEKGASGASPVVGDEAFLRRVSLDLTGRLPTPEDLAAFTASSEPDKRAKAIDRLLESDVFASRWAVYWADTIAARAAPFMQRLTPLLNEWLAEQFRRGRGWDEIVRDMLTAESALADTARKGNEVGPGQPRNGAAFFVATRFYDKKRDEGAVDAAAETARLFLGIQLQCAQCHDDRAGAPWERVQFHQFAAYFGRAGGRPANKKIGPTVALDTWALVYYPDGEYEMPDAKEPTKAYTVAPAFLDGATPGAGLSDKERRAALADAVTGPGGFWFAAAFTNRAWKEMLGRGFYEPVDDMGPGREGKRTDVLAALAAHFRATKYYIRGLFRLIANTKAYQRGSVPFGADTGLTATAARRLPAEAVWAALERVMEPANRPAAPAAKKSGRPAAPAAEFLTEFAFDPSIRPERTLTQVLWLMNSRTLDYGLKAGRSKLLAAATKAADRQAGVDLLYVHTLGRHPTKREREIAAGAVAEAKSPAEGFEDLLWALVNTPEFLTNR